MAVALQPMLPNPARPVRRVSRDELVAHLEAIRMDTATTIAESMATQQRCLAVMAATGAIWRALTGEEAPEIEVQPRVVRAS